MSTHLEKGSLWHQWDLHFHTPSSFDYADKGVTNQQMVDTLVGDGVRVIAITDHHTIDIGRIRELQELGSDKLTVLPGIELRSDQGGDPIHYISIFPEDCDLDHVWETLKGKLDLTDKAIADNGGRDAIYVPIEKGAQVTRDLGGVVTIHAGRKSNSIDGITNKEQFQRCIKYDITNKWVDIMEVGQIKDIDVHHNTIFPAIKLTRPLAICSDNHNIANYSRKAPLWFKADPTFRGLLMVLREPIDRVYIGDSPPELQRMAENSTKYIDKVIFKRSPSAPASQQWFGGEINFNPGLVAIVGNKGSGKSALSDTLGLLGATKNSDSFSFLTRQRFNHPKAGFGSHFEAMVSWRSGETQSRSLSDAIPEEEPERLKYLPQDHVEKVCNELDGVDKGDFEKELKSVIFSHVPETSRLGQLSLDQLVHFSTAEKQKRIDTLLKQLRDISRERSVAETQLNPKVRLEIDEKIKRKKLEIDAHNNAKPIALSDPNAEGAAAPTDPELSKQLSDAEILKATLEEQIANAILKQKSDERKLAVAKRLLEKIDNFKKEHNTFEESIHADVTELGLENETLVFIAVDVESIEGIRDQATESLAGLRETLGEGKADGLLPKLKAVSDGIGEVHAKLDEPNRLYQGYLKRLGQWTERGAELVGKADIPDSLEGLKSALSSLDGLPSKVVSIRGQQQTLSKEIHVQKQDQAEVYRRLYGPVQEFINGHHLAADKLKLEFKAELIDQGFASQLLDHLAQNRRGSFMGADDGMAKAVSLSESVDWADASSVERFLESVDQALHENQRDAELNPMQLEEQLAKGHSAEDVFNFLYGLEYVEPRYILRWEGKDLSMLSPGERGTLLLVFYLLIDQGDLPLVIDQPEGNLDNHTIAKILVDCIREARKHRQVFIVTHNPNLAVVCDADQVVHAEMDKENGNAVTYTSGALENPEMSKYVTDVLEGTRWAFDVRGAKYKVGE